MSETNEALKAKYAEIATLKKEILEKKRANRNNSTYPSAQPTGGVGKAPFAARGGYSFRARGGFRGGFRGFRGGYRGGFAASPSFTHRNMTLVFDKSVPSDQGTEPKYVTQISKGGMSLVNTELYEKDKEKYLAIQKSQQDLREKMIQQKKARAMQTRISKYRTKTDSCDRIEIGGDKFAVTRAGNKLLPLTVPVGIKPKEEKWNNRTYQRKQNGSLKCNAGRKRRYVSEPTHKHHLLTFRIPQDDCRYFCRTGICQKGSTCKYNHDKLRIRFCRLYLANKCFNRNCLLSHECSEYNTPLCKYYLENKCNNSQCYYLHHKPPGYDLPNHEIWVCRPFAIGGWCERGKKCPFLHFMNCPDFEEDGVCLRGNSCQLAHPITKRTQDLMVTPSNKYEFKPEVDEVLVESDNEDESKPPRKVVISSYTVDPELLFVTSNMDGKYDIYIDKTTPLEPSTTNTFKENSAFMIHLSDSESGSDLQDNDSSSGDEIENNNDYIEF